MNEVLLSIVGLLQGNFGYWGHTRGLVDSTRKSEMSEPPLYISISAIQVQCAANQLIGKGALSAAAADTPCNE